MSKFVRDDILFVVCLVAAGIVGGLGIGIFISVLIERAS